MGREECTLTCNEHDYQIRNDCYIANPDNTKIFTLIMIIYIKYVIAHVKFVLIQATE